MNFVRGLHGLDSGTSRGAVATGVVRWCASPPAIAPVAVLASFLSAVSLGLGYLWCLLDQDGLCWHDGITRTYVQSERRAE